MARYSFSGLLLVTLAYFACGCHGRRSSLVVMEMDTKPATVTVSGYVDEPVVVPVSGVGMTLRTAVEAVRVKDNAAEVSPGSMYAAISRPEGDYFIALSLISTSVAGDIQLKPNSHVRIVPWEKTDLARGLSVNRQRVTKLPMQSASLSSMVDWVNSLFDFKVTLAGPAFAPEKIQIANETKENFDALINAIYDEIEAGFTDITKDENFKKNQKSLNELSNDKQSRNRWLADEFIPFVANLAKENTTKFESYLQDWAYLKELYQNRAPVTPDRTELAAIDATFLAPTPPKAIAENLLRVAPARKEKQIDFPGQHPTFDTYYGLLTALPDPGIVRLVRTVNGRRSEFVMELITAKVKWDLSNRDLEQDYVRLHSMLIFDGDVVEVTTVNRVAPVVEGLIQDVLNSRISTPPRKSTKRNR